LRPTDATLPARLRIGEHRIGLDSAAQNAAFGG
jgi:hypothetical protein